MGRGPRRAETTNANVGMRVMQTGMRMMDTSLPKEKDLREELDRIRKNYREQIMQELEDDSVDDDSIDYGEELSSEDVSQFLDFMDQNVLRQMPPDRELTELERIALQYRLQEMNWEEEDKLPEGISSKRELDLLYIDQLVSRLPKTSEGRRLDNMLRKSLGISADDDIMKSIREQTNNNSESIKNTIAVLEAVLASAEDPQADVVRSWLAEEMDRIRAASTLGGREAVEQPFVMMPRYAWLTLGDADSSAAGMALAAPFPGAGAQHFTMVIPQERGNENGKALINRTLIVHAALHESIHATQDNSMIDWSHLPEGWQQEYINLQEGMTEALTILKSLDNESLLSSMKDEELWAVGEGGKIEKVGTESRDTVPYAVQVHAVFRLLQRAGVAQEDLEDRLQYLNSLPPEVVINVLEEWTGQDLLKAFQEDCALLQKSAMGPKEPRSFEEEAEQEEEADRVQTIWIDQHLRGLSA